MKKIFLAIAAIALVTGIYSFAPKSFSDAYSVDVAKSKIEWGGSAADHYHVGVVGVKSGSVTVDAGKITGGKFVIDLASLKSTDGAGDRLDGHLKSPDFFDVTKFGEATYEISSVKYTSKEKAEITGKLTLKGATAPVSFTATVRGVDDKKLFAEASFSLDRTAFGVNYGIGKVSNDISITVHLFAAK